MRIVLVDDMIVAFGVFCSTGSHVHIRAAATEEIVAVYFADQRSVFARHARAHTTFADPGILKRKLDSGVAARHTSP